MTKANRSTSTILDIVLEIFHIDGVLVLASSEDEAIEIAMRLEDSIAMQVY